MKLFTDIPIKPRQNPISYHSSILMLGSCFAEHIGGKLEYFKFPILQNPLGILYHPLTIENLLHRSVNEKLYHEEDLFFLNDRWHCFDAHSIMSDVDQSETLSNLNEALQNTNNVLATATHIFITLGTSWVYRYKETNAIVGNCHKVAQAQFEKVLLSATEIESSLLRCVQHIKTQNAHCNISFTISPVRHHKDGIIANQRSKANLITAIHNLLEQQGEQSVDYFPAYEVMMDELRDYRYYDRDLVHPNALAVEYIWEKYVKAYIDREAVSTMKEVDLIQKGLAHRPIAPQSQGHKKFEKNLQDKIERLRTRLPQIKF